jgi:hypothetical protein
MKKLIFYLFISVIGVNAQEKNGIYRFPRRDNFQEKIKVALKRTSNGIFEYTYSITNYQESEQSIAQYYLICDTEITRVSSPMDWIFYNNKNAMKMVWGAGKISSQILPGESKSGFLLLSPGLPVIRTYLCRSYVVPATLEIEPDSTENNLVSQNCKKGQTIAPRSTIADYSPLDFIDSLIVMVRNSEELGWISGQEIEKKYESNLSSIKSQIEHQLFFEARSTIGSLLNEIRLDSNNALSVEAYTILRYNSKYLLDQLPEPSNPYLTVKLTDSESALMMGGVLEYNEGGWKCAEDRGDGTFSVTTELPSVKLRMTYEHGVQEKPNVPVKGNTYIFRTIGTNVRLKNSQQSLTDTGKVQYYSGGWFDLGITSNGIARKELLPGNYKFRMTYGHASVEKYQDIGLDSVVVFQTVPVDVKLQDSRSAALDTGSVEYYAGGWWDFGTTANGATSKELLPYNYKFRMTYAKASNEKYQDVGQNPIVLFQTTPVNVKLTDSRSALMDTGKVQYYSGGWWDLGTTSGGIVSKALLPYNYKFRMTFARASNEKYQDVGVNPEVVFQTVKARVELKDSRGNSMDAGEVKYYSGGWWDFGTTSNGVSTKELLPVNYKFRMIHAKAANEKYQDVGTDPNVLFQTVNTRVELRNSLGALMDAGSVKYYSGGWWNFGTTSNGAASMELLPFNYKFRMTYANGSNEKYQDTGTNALVVFPAVSAVVRVSNLQGQPVNGADVKYYSGGWFPFGVTSGGTISKELLPFNYKFRATAGSKQSEKYQDLSVNPIVDFTLDVP